MKSITFNAQRNESTIDELKRIVDQFLRKHSSYDDMDKYTKTDGYRILFTMDCANNTFTRAFALLQLIFSDMNGPAYIKYDKQANFILVIGYGGQEAITKTIQYISNHMNVTIYS